MSHADELSAPSGGIFRGGAVRGAEGYFRAGQDQQGRWWLIDPGGSPCFARGVHDVRRAGVSADGEMPRDPAVRLREWGFNVMGVGADAAVREDGVPFLASVEFCPAIRPIVSGEARLPDVFDPEWPRLAAARAAEVCGPLASSRELVGWVTDSALNWAGPTLAGRPSLLQICLSLEPGFAAYHAAWEFVLAHHGGRLESVAQAWHAELPNKEMVRELTRAEEGLGTRGYLRDDARWTRECARRYFSTTAAVIRAADPNHLVLGCRFSRAVGPQVLAECVYPAVDVAMPHWTELPPALPGSPQPALANDVSWLDDERMRGARPGRARRLTSFERMLRRGRISLERLARHPAVLGYTWIRWEDEPGEQPPFGRGLVHVNGAEAREHTELLAQFNARAEALRRGGG